MDLVTGGVIDNLIAYKRSRGHSSEVAEMIVQKALGYAEQAIEVLNEVMSDREQDARDRVTAANHMLDRAIGKPQQKIQATTTTGTYKDLLHLVDVQEQVLSAIPERELTVRDVLRAQGQIQEQVAMIAEYREVNYVEEDRDEDTGSAAVIPDTTGITSAPNNTTGTVDWSAFI